MNDHGGDTLTGDKTASDLFAEMIAAPQKLFTQFMPGGSVPLTPPPGADFAAWTAAAQKAQAQWLEMQQAQLASASAQIPAMFMQPSGFGETLQGWLKALPLARPEVQNKLWNDSMALWETVLGQYGIGPKAEGQSGDDLALPRSDRRFKDPKWREQPFYAVIHQTYLMLAEQIMAQAEAAPATDQARAEQLRFAARTLVEMLSPANFALTNPLVMEKAVATNGQSLAKGMQHLLDDLRKGQLTHVDPGAFKLGENIATAPGKVVHQTPLYQLIHYAPTTQEVFETPLVIFPPWINRFYILDLSPQKSFIRWAVDQGLSVFVVSWKSADESLKDVLWDDYIRAQIDAIDTIRARLDTKAVHTIGYCVAGTTLAATLAVLARRGEAEKVKSATFFTAQVDFELAGELKVFIDDQQMAALEKLSAQTGYLDGRVMAATFNLLRGTDLIWNYVVNNYLLGDDYPAFDLLHWNGDVTNLPAKWHMSYLKDLYRDNRLVVPDALTADGTPIDLTRIETPAYIQAGREDHIAPAESVWRLMHHLSGPKTFVLAGSGHIAGVVNPPSSGKYQYWTNSEATESFAEFVAGAQETPGSWWPHWIEWIAAQDGRKVPVKDKRTPGLAGEQGLEDAPGSYVKAR